MSLNDCWGVRSTPAGSIPVNRAEADRLHGLGAEAGLLPRVAVPAWPEPCMPEDMKGPDRSHTATGARMAGCGS